MMQRLAVIPEGNELSCREEETVTSRLKSSIDAGDARLLQENLDHIQNGFTKYLHALFVLEDSAEKGSADCLGILLNITKTRLATYRKCSEGVNEAKLQKVAQIKFDVMLGALYKSAANGHACCVKLLLDSGAHTGVVITPLQIAVENGYADCVELLLPLAYEFDKSISFDLAIKYGRVEFLELLLPFVTKDKKSSALRLAIESDQVGCLKFLLKNKPVDKVFYCDAISTATRQGCLDCLQFFLDKEEERELVHSQALQIAAENGRLDSLQFLLDYMEAYYADKESALKIAIMHSHIECAEFLNGGELNLETLLDREICCYKPDVKYIKMLLAHGADIQAMYKDDRTITVDDSLMSALLGVAISINDSCGLSPEEKKVIKAFHYWRYEDKPFACVKNVNDEARKFLSNLSDFDDETRAFVVDNCLLVDHDAGCDANLLISSVMRVGIRKTLVNLAYYYGNKIIGIADLLTQPVDEVLRFLNTIELDGEFIGFSTHPVEEESKGQEVIWKIVTGRLSSIDVTILEQSEKMSVMGDSVDQYFEGATLCND